MKFNFSSRTVAAGQLKGIIMNLVSLIILIIVAGVLLWGVNVFIPMPMLIKNLLNFVVFVVLLIYVLQFFNLIKMILPFPTLFK